MNIPHGTQASPELKWNLTGGDNALITKSGTYKIEAVVTPVDTTRAESHTGSSRTGSQSPKTITEEPKANIFVLEITAADSQLEKGQAVDFARGENNITQDVKTHSSVHIVDMKWVCLDGVTPSDPANEPGTAPLKVGSTVSANISVPNAEDYIATDSGTDTVAVDEGEYIPVIVAPYRRAGDINKDTPANKQIEQKVMYLRDNDNLYGTDSSVRWVHECEIIDDCDESEFQEAQRLNDNGAIGEPQNNVRFLVHVLSNPMPVIHKTTSTPTILKGEMIEWQIAVSNDDIKTNPGQNRTTFTVVDALPFDGDERYDEVVNQYCGSQFHGTLKYEEVTVDFSKEPSSMQGAKMYWTSGTAARSDAREDIAGASWTEAAGTTSGNLVTYTIPEEAIAIRLDASLPFHIGGGLTINALANVTNVHEQQLNDTYLNKAFVYNNTAMKESETVRTEVLSMFIDGRVWQDNNHNGIRENGDTVLKGIAVGLYTRHTGTGPGGPYTITVGGEQFDRAFDVSGDIVGLVRTNNDGTYRFDNLNPGEYFVIATDISGIMEPVEKNVGTDTKIDSDAEMTKPEAATAWIQGITLSTQSARYQDIGLEEARGSITVNKKLTGGIYYPGSLNSEEKNAYEVHFLFDLVNDTTGRKLTKVARISREKNYFDTVVFEDLELGTYTLTEQRSIYTLVSMISSDEEDIITLPQRSVKITITADRAHHVIDVINGIAPSDNIHQTSVINHVGGHVPTSLTLKYVGPNPIHSDTLTSYTFTESDFDPNKGGDMIVTYDDGSTISLSEGTLNFSDVTLSPASVTNLMNSGRNSAEQIAGYYTERGMTLMDYFNVVIDLKPIHKYKLTFNSNGGTFTAETPSHTLNVMDYGYDEIARKAYVTRGTYAEPDRTSFTFAGWNTSSDGTGVQYNDQAALTAIGQDASVTAMTLYANWKVPVVFNANGGKFSDNTTEKTELLTIGQTLATTLTPSKANSTFLGWNTKANATGTWLDDYGQVTGPVTMYAIYLQTEFPYTGTVQTFTAISSGTYLLQTWGAQGGGANAPWAQSAGGVGGYSEGKIHLNAGDTLYVFVGGQGTASAPNASTGGGYNGGGNGHTWILNGSPCPGYGGGGMTHISTTNNLAVATETWDPTGTLIVAGGGGGAEDAYGNAGGDNDGRGGWGGGTTGGPSYNNGAPNNSHAGTQTSGYAQGRGMSASSGIVDIGGGGADWWGGKVTINVQNPGGAGGSGWVGGVQDGRTVAGNNYFASPSGATERGHAGNGYARITVVSYD